MASSTRYPTRFDFSASDLNLKQSWESWKTAFKWYLQANEKDGKSEKVKVGLLLDALGPRGHEIFSTFKLSAADQDNYATVISKFDEYCGPSHHKAYQDYLFFNRMQKQGEPVETFYNDCLRLLLDSELLDVSKDALKDRLLLYKLTSGLLNNEVRSRLLQNPDYTLKDAYTYVRNFEAAVKESSVMQPPSGVDGVQSTKYQTHTQGFSTGRKLRCKYCCKEHQYGKQHCPAANMICHRCKVVGHFQQSLLCKQRSRRTMEIADDGVLTDGDFTDIFTIELIPSAVDSVHQDHSAWFQTVEVRGRHHRFKLDTGSCVNVISKANLIQMLGHLPKLDVAAIRLRNYSHQAIPVLGKTTIIGTVDSIPHALDFMVVDFNGENILGWPTIRDQLKLVSTQSDKICSAVVPPRTSDDWVFTEFSDVFSDKPGTLPGYHHLHIDKSVPPRQDRMRRFPLFSEAAIKEALHEMLSDGIIEHVDTTSDCPQWISSMLVRKKPNGQLRICLDPRPLNKALCGENYGVPTVESILSRVGKSKYFIHCDASKAFWHLKLDDESKALLTFNTPLGLMRYTCIPYEVKPASEKFQREMDLRFQDLEKVECSIDDFLIHAPTKAAHDQNLRAFLTRCRQVGLKLNRSSTRL